jgi:hypothetical protein
MRGILMIVPNKVVSLDDSVLPKLSIILNAFDSEINLIDLHEKVKGKFNSINHFMLTIDVLYLLNKIDVNFDTKTVNHA